MKQDRTWLEICTFGDLLYRGAIRHPDRDCIVFPEVRRSYRELADRATEVARSLRALGVERGDHVGILMPSCMDFADLLFGITFLGAVAVPLNARFRARELGYAIENADLKVVVTSDIIEQHTDYVSLLRESVPGLSPTAEPTALDLKAAPELRAAVLMGSKTVGGFLDREAFDALADQVDPGEIEACRERVRLRDNAVIFYTSGTTSMPKGCPLTHEALVRNGMTTSQRIQLEEGARYWGPLPMFHTGATQPYAGALAVGGTYLTMTHFEPGPALEMIEREKVTNLFTAFPTITLGLLNHPSYKPESFKGVKTIFNLAPPDSLRETQERLPHSIQIGGFGMTEFGGSMALNDPDEPLATRIANQGRPLPGVEIEIRDPETGAVLGPSQRGEIVVRGPTMFDGYVKAPELNATVLENGWFHTGDLGTVDENGGLSYQGRLKDMLKVGGENVAAIEIEDQISTHPAVCIAAVVGVPDEKYLEVPAVFIELNPGKSASEDEIIEHCRQSMARFKVPRYVRFVKEWPMSATKIQKFKLRDDLSAELGLS